MPAKICDAGELRTAIRIVRPVHQRDRTGTPVYDEEGHPVTEMVNVFGCGQVRHCKWTNAWGSEVYAAEQAGALEPATLTMRFARCVTPDCLIYKGCDPRPYEVISIDDVDDRHQWLAIKVKRQVAAV